MAWWAWLLDVAGVLLLLALLYGLALVVRRRWISRDGGTFEFSVRVRSARAGRGWVLGVGRYNGDVLEWFRIFSIAPTPKLRFSRSDLEYVFGVAHEMRGMVERVGTFDLLKGKILANLFYEPSTRTSSSFTAAKPVSIADPLCVSGACAAAKSIHGRMSANHERLEAAASAIGTTVT